MSKCNRDSDMPIVWIDCEMTGLNHKKDHIIEICCLITDKDLKLIDPAGYESVIHCPKSIMDGMDEWCTSHHGKSGLTRKVIESTKTAEQVDSELVNYLKQYMSPGVGILAGNSVHVDRLYMLKDLPRVVNYLTYRIIDVSSIYEVSKRHNNKITPLVPPKIGAHTARMDIIESINQLKFYEDVYLKSPQEIDSDAVRAKYSGFDINGNPLKQPE